jgi:hypothetical protein
MTRLQRILAALLGVQLLLAVVVFWPRSRPVEAGAPLLGSLTAEQISGLAITGETGEQVQLARSGETWSLPAAGDYPADGVKIANALRKLVAIQTGRLVARTPASFARLKVSGEDFVRRVQITAQDGKQTTLYVGSSSGGQASHVRLDGQNEIYLAEELPNWELGATAGDWVDATFLNLEVEPLTRAVLRNASGTIEFEKDLLGNWTFKDQAPGEQLDVNKLTSLLSQAATLRLTAPLGKQALPEYGLAAPSAVLELSDANQTVTLTIGASLSDGQSYYAFASTSEYYVTVPGFSVESLVSNSRQDFVAPPATPTP